MACTFSVGSTGRDQINAHLPKYNVSDRMKDPIIATRIMVRGLKAVTKTGPLSFIITA